MSEINSTVENSHHRDSLAFLARLRESLQDLLTIHFQSAHAELRLLCLQKLQYVSGESKDGRSYMRFALKMYVETDEGPAVEPVGLTLVVDPLAPEEKLCLVQSLQEQAL